MTAGSLASVMVLLVASVVGVTILREIANGRDEMTQAEAARGRSDWPTAIAHARAAAEALVPASPWPGRGMLRLESMGRDAEARGDEETALLAYGAMRTAALATGAPLRASLSERWRTVAEEGLARVATSLSEPRAAGPDTQSLRAVPAPSVATQAMMDELRDGHPLSSVTLSLLAAVSIAAVVALLRLAAATT